MRGDKRFGDLKPEERKAYILELLTRIKHQREAEERAARVMSESPAREPAP